MATKKSSKKNDSDVQSSKSFSLPFSVRSEKDCKDKFWESLGKDFGEQCLPSNEGLITEMVYAMRGSETPVIYLIWAGIVSINSMLKREAWIEWYPHKLFPNMYVCLVGGAGDKKSASLDAWYEVIRRAVDFLKESDPYMGVVKDLKIVKDRTTPEALLDTLLPSTSGLGDTVQIEDKRGVAVLGEDGFVLTYDRTSEALVYVSELSTLFSKATYSATMSEIFLDIFDTHEEWGFKTKSAGQKYLRKLCTSLLGATTPIALRTSLPENMLGDGFLSRTTLVFLERNTKYMSMPREVVGAPSFDELGMKMSWIAKTCVGGHTLSEEAQKRYDEWYMIFKMDLAENPETAGVKSRMDKILLKVALAFKAQRYCSGDRIELVDLEDAIRLIELTYSKMGGLINTIGKKEFMQEYQKVKALIQECSAIMRDSLVLKAKIPSDLLNKILDQLKQEGSISIVLNNEGRKVPSRNRKEMYIWCGKGKDEV
jgi:hypothetical protein